MLALRTAFSFSLPHRTVPKCAQAGVLDDSSRLRLVVGTVTNKVIIHETDTVLNINEKILALAVAPLGTPYDLVIIGTTSSVLAYDVQKNTNLFRKDVADGIACIQVGSFSSHGTLAMCGGNCAIWGLDASGRDSFWTVTGDNVLSLCLCDIDNDGVNELVAGSEDFDIRVFKDDLLLFELSETDAVTCVHDIGNGRFAYALANGTLGAYQREIRLWRIKSKNQIAALVTFPDTETLACVWSGGKVNISNF
ncbi:unnamed protein product [Toxocara canis]|uniref:Bardet-Biedl syndrome 2 protein homolog n=1 Tax=Toxocara canis TaxID=6265 RepID=A0A183U234_TOXCA|nr:unnamed protein product [Toxocara canis]